MAGILSNRCVCRLGVEEVDGAVALMNFGDDGARPERMKKTCSSRSDATVQFKAHEDVEVQDAVLGHGCEVDGSR